MSRYETAPYKVIEKDGDFEIRKYEAFFTASVKEASVAETQGFSTVFSYINGKNATGSPIAMTTPVLNNMEKGNTTTEFVMPSSYTENNPPEPMDPSITIRRYEAHTAASLQFSGSISDEKIQAHEKKLSEWLRQKGKHPTGSFRLARYNAPFMPPAFRRNEILTDLEDEFI
jgi:hypothetical protein